MEKYFQSQDKEENITKSEKKSEIYRNLWCIEYILIISYLEFEKERMYRPPKPAMKSTQLFHPLQKLLHV